MRLNEQIDKFKKLTGLLTEAWLNPGWATALFSRIRTRLIPDYVEIAFKDLITSGKIKLNTNKTFREVNFNLFTQQEIELFFRSKEVREGLEEYLSHSGFDINSPAFINGLRALETAHPGHSFVRIINAYESQASKIIKPSLVDNLMKWTPDTIKKWWQNQITSARISQYWLRYKKALSNDQDLKTKYISVLQRYNQKLIQGGNYDFTAEQREIGIILSQTTSLRKKFLMELWRQWKDLMPVEVKKHILEKGYFQDDKFEQVVKFFEEVEPQAKKMLQDKDQYVTRFQALLKMLTPNFKSAERPMAKFLHRFTRFMTTLDARLKYERVKNIELSDSKANYYLENIKDRLFSMIFIWPIGYGMLELIQEMASNTTYGLTGLDVSFGAESPYPGKDKPKDFAFIDVAKESIGRYIKDHYLTTDINLLEMFLSNSPIGHAIYGFMRDPNSAKKREAGELLNTEFNRKKQAVVDSINKSPLPPEIKKQLLDSIPTLDEMKAIHVDSVQVQY
jgi:hypothetical protein